MNEKLKKAIIIILTLLLLFAVVLGMISFISPEKAAKINQAIDASWWLVSIIRWIVLAIIIIWVLPKILNKQLDRQSAFVNSLKEERSNAQDQGAAYETLTGLDYEIADAEKKAHAFSLMIEKKSWIAISLVAIEIIVVQLPHWI